jgi:hypothetical protein
MRRDCFGDSKNLSRASFIAWRESGIERMGCAEHVRGTICTKGQPSTQLAISNFSSVDGFQVWGSSVGFHHLARR